MIFKYWIRPDGWECVSVVCCIYQNIRAQCVKLIILLDRSRHLTSHFSLSQCRSFGGAENLSREEWAEQKTSCLVRSEEIMWRLALFSHIILAVVKLTAAGEYHIMILSILLSHHITIINSLLDKSLCEGCEVISREKDWSKQTI